MSFVTEIFLVIFGIGLGIFMEKILCRKVMRDNFNKQQNFISAASHEFRTPLTIIRGYADMLEKFGAEDEEIFLESVLAIKNSAQNMQELIEKVLFLSRAEQNILLLEKKSVDVSELLKNLIESYNNPRIEFFCGENFNFVGDKSFLEKMFAEIIDNALKFSAEKISVTVKKNSVEISDSGIGIASENFEKIFEKFFKVDKSRTKTDSEKISAGLGLSIAKFIADAHKIKITVESKLNIGTKITLKF